VNSSQSMVATYRYDPFGNPIALSGSLAAANVYRFSSKEIHGKSGMYYYGYRFYDPNLQRWLNRDPIEEFGGLNLYAFVYNNPIAWTDLWGLDVTAPPPSQPTIPGTRPGGPSRPPPVTPPSDNGGGGGNGKERCLELLQQMLQQLEKMVSTNPWDGGIDAATKFAQLSAEFKALGCEKILCPAPSPNPKPPKPPEVPWWQKIPPFWRWPMFMPWWWGPGGIPTPDKGIVWA